MSDELKSAKALAAKWKRRAVDAEKRVESMQEELRKWRGYEPGRWSEVLVLTDCGVPMHALARAAHATGSILSVHLIADGKLSVRIARRPDNV